MNPLTEERVYENRNSLSGVKPVKMASKIANDVPSVVGEETIPTK